MNSLKTLLVVGVLGAVGYGVFTAMTEQKPAEEPPGVAPDWAAGPQIEMPGMTGPQADLGPSSGGHAHGSAPPAATAGGHQYGDHHHADHEGSHDHGDQHGPRYAVEAPPYGQTAMNGGDTSGGAGGHSGGDRYAAAPRYGEGSTGDAPAGGYQGDHGHHGDHGATVSGGAAQGTGAAGFDAAMEQVHQQLDQDDVAAAHLSLSQLYAEPSLSPEKREQVLGLLNQVAGTVIYSYRHHLLEQPYTVSAGETLESIAQRYQVPWQLLANINGVSDPLQPGTQLKVVRGPFHAKVESSTGRVTLWLGERYAGSFSATLGQSVSGPGELVVKEKVPPGDPKNPWNSHWLDLGRGIGIHGTTGGAGTEGSIELDSQDAADIFAILSVGSRITILR